MPLLKYRYFARTLRKFVLIRAKTVLIDIQRVMILKSSVLLVISLIFSKLVRIRMCQHEFQKYRSSHYT